MSKDCTKYEPEITAAAGGELSTEVSDHLSNCSRCAELRTDTLTLASSHGPQLAPVAAVALARSALRNRDVPVRRAHLWIAPLVSASASVATLILYFGLTIDPSSTAQPVALSGDHIIAAEEVKVESTSTPRLPSLTEMTLPDTFEASYDLLLIGNSREDES